MQTDTLTQIDHDVFVAEKKHHRHRIVQFVHFIEIGHFGDVYQINDGKILHFLSNFEQHLQSDLSIFLKKNLTKIQHFEIYGNIWN
jgi:hypothetical protein